MTSDWRYSPEHGQICRVIESQTIWGTTICRVWLPDRDAVVRIPESRLLSVGEGPSGSGEFIVYAAAAAKIADSLAQDVLLAPIESTVIPLPHQIQALSRATSGDRIRYLLADEVGLGKTIEAGLILRELKLRGHVKRTLIVAPKGLVTQWVSEMRFHFGETFQLLLPDDLKSLRRVVPDPNGWPGDAPLGGEHSLPANAWQVYSQVVVPMDSIKPMDKRKGWSAAQVGEFNRERFEDLISAGWDMVIVDEAHRLGGSTDQVARFKLGQGLAEAAPYLLLLSATPHQGKTDAFHRILSLVDPLAFPDVASVTRDRVHPYVIRTEKRHAINAEGLPLFKPRRTELIPVCWAERHSEQRLLYEAVTSYVREGYNQAIVEKRSYIGFLMLLMQRLVVSSTRAIRTTLERRLEALARPPEELPLFPDFVEEEWADLDGQEQMDLLLKSNLKALRNERAEVKMLLQAAARCIEGGPDAKAEALLDRIYQIQSEEGDPNLKVLVFTEFVPTQEMLADFLRERGFSVVCLNGSLGMDERKHVQEEFAKDFRILISTDAGGEGLNLQFCHVVVNYDIPWNPMRLEQRIGRVDRIGQLHPVRANNLVFEESVEFRVREVLEEKLAVIFEDFGVDKTGDVLDSAQAGALFDELYVDAILHPECIEASVASMTGRLKTQAQDTRSTASLLGSSEKLDPHEAQRLQTHPMPYWVECMTISYLKSHQGDAQKGANGWNLKWPDGETIQRAVFNSKEAEALPAARYLTLEDPRIRGLAMRLPQFAPGQLIPDVEMVGVDKHIRGTLSLWSIALSTSDWNRRRILPLFLADSDRVFLPTARHLWEQLLGDPVSVDSFLSREESLRIFDRLRLAAEDHGKPIYDALVQEHLASIQHEREKFSYSFGARRSAIERIGLPQVRQHRLNRLLQEERRAMGQLDLRAQTYPDMTPLLLVNVTGGSLE